MEKEILKKLNLTERGASFILSDKELCDRIMKENPVWINDFVDRHPISSSKLDHLIRNNIISSFRNKSERGAKVFIFEDEVFNIVKSNINNYSYYNMMDLQLESFMAISGKVLEGMDLTVMNHIMVERKTYEEVASQYGLSRERIRQLFNRADRRSKRYVSNLLDYNELKDSINNLTKDKNELEKQISKLKKDYDVEDDNHYLSLSIHDADLSIRCINALHAADVETLGDIARLTKNDLCKFRNFGRKSLTEIDELLEEYNLTLKNR